MEYKDKCVFLITFVQTMFKGKTWFDESTVLQAWKDAGHHPDGLLGCDEDEADGTEALDCIESILEEFGSNLVVENHGYDGYFVVEK